MDNTVVAFKPAIIIEDSVEQWESDLVNLSRDDRSMPWRIGDHLLIGEKSYGVTFKRVAAITGRKVQGLKNMAWVAERVESSRRRDDLSWAHHAEVAALNPEAQDAWLSAAADNHWSQKALRTRIKSKQIEATTSVLPEYPKCGRCGRGCGWCSPNIGRVRLETAARNAGLELTNDEYHAIGFGGTERAAEKAERRRAARKARREDHHLHVVEAEPQEVTIQ